MPSPHARGYLVGNGEPVDVTEIYPYYWGAGNLVADADDVALFYKALMRGKLVTPASLKEMKTVVAQTPDRGQGLGLVSGKKQLRPGRRPRRLGARLLLRLARDEQRTAGRVPRQLGVDRGQRRQPRWPRRRWARSSKPPRAAPEGALRRQAARS